MRALKKYASILACLVTLLLLNSCAAGSVTAGYALKAKETESLTAEGEQKLVNRIKREVSRDFYNQDYPQTY